MKQKYELDERQQLNRGIAFQYSFISAMIIMLVVYLLIDVIEVNISISNAFQMCFFIPVTICLMTMIIKDGYDFVNFATGKIIFSMWGLAGLSLISATLCKILSNGYSLFELETRMDYEGHLIIDCSFLLISVTYWIKQYSNMRKFKKK